MTTTPLNISAAEVADLLPMDKLIAGLRRAFAEGCNAPARQHHTIRSGDGGEGTLLLMPAWSGAGERRYIGVKLVNVFPANSDIGKPAVTSVYSLFDGNTGEHLAFMEGNAVTSRRTAAVAALAADHLSRRDSTRLLLLGAGRVASLLPDAYRAVRPIETVQIWDIDPTNAERLATSLEADGFRTHIVASLDEAVSQADIVSAATLSTVPLVKGACLRPGTHVDLIGAFTPAMREGDNDLMASVDLYIDTEEALSEAGDLVVPLAEGIFAREMVKGSLADLCSNRVDGRKDDAAKTLFKTVGTSLADLSAVVTAYESTTRST